MHLLMGSVSKLQIIMRWNKCRADIYNLLMQAVSKYHSTIKHSMYMALNTGLPEQNKKLVNVNWEKIPKLTPPCLTPFCIEKKLELLLHHLTSHSQLTYLNRISLRSRSISFNGKHSSEMVVYLSLGCSSKLIFDKGNVETCCFSIKSFSPWHGPFKKIF